MTGTLRIDADLALEHDGDEIGVWDEEETLVVNAPSFRAARRLRDAFTKLPIERFDPLNRLEETGLTVDVRVRHASIARFGAGVDGGTIESRLLGRGGTVHWRGVLAAVARRLG